MNAILHERPAMFEVCAGDIDALNVLLRGELTAVEAYDEAIEKFDRWNAAREVARIRDNHALAATLLRDQILDYGGRPATESGLRGHFAIVLTRIARMIGTQSVLVALKECEEIGFERLESAIANPAIAPAARELISTALIAAACENLDRLNRLVMSKPAAASQHPAHDLAVA